ncbi:MAG: hypothetical protein K2J02_00300, partial [Malacoplasma sp.]|nr:hypothetical protein [Malacoplasma sp.]
LRRLPSLFVINQDIMYNQDKIFFNNKKIYEILFKANKIFLPDFVFVKSETLKNENIKKLLKKIPSYQID